MNNEGIFRFNDLVIIVILSVFTCMHLLSGVEEKRIEEIQEPLKISQVQIPSFASTPLKEIHEEDPELFDGDRRLEVLRESGQWTDSAKLTLAQSLYGEAGLLPFYKRIGKRGKVIPCDPENDSCFRNRDWEIIPWVLLKRWEVLNSKMNFEEVIRAYSSPVNKSLASVQREIEAKTSANHAEMACIQRRRFIQSIDWLGKRLNRSRSRALSYGLPETYFETGWFLITLTVEDWIKGRISNPCEEALHWNSPGSRNISGFPRVDCGETLNRYFGKRILF